MQREGEAAQSDGRVTPHSPDTAAQATPDKNCPITQGDAASALTDAFKYSHTLPAAKADLPSNQVGGWSRSQSQGPSRPQLLPGEQSHLQT